MRGPEVGEGEGMNFMISITDNSPLQTACVEHVHNMYYMTVVLYILIILLCMYFCTSTKPLYE